MSGLSRTRALFAMAKLHSITQYAGGVKGTHSPDRLPELSSITGMPRAAKTHKGYGGKVGAAREAALALPAIRILVEE